MTDEDRRGAIAERETSDGDFVTSSHSDTQSNATHSHSLWARTMAAFTDRLPAIYWRFSLSHNVRESCRMHFLKSAQRASHFLLAGFIDLCS